MTLASGVLGVFRDPPVIPDPHVAAVETAIKKRSQSFVRDDRELEMGVCATIAVVLAIEGGGKVSEGWAIADVLATAVWSGATFLQPSSGPKLETLRLETISAAQARILGSSLDTRIRHKVPDFGPFGDDAVGAEAFGKATAGTIKALRYNAALDREELDMLWWVLADTSMVLAKPLASLSAETRAIATGIELGALLRRLPSQSHRNLCVRGVSEADQMSLPSLLDALGEDRMALAASFENETLVDDAPSVFPLLNGMRAGSSALAGAEVLRPLSEWCARALLERAVLGTRNREHRRI